MEHKFVERPVIAGKRHRAIHAGPALRQQQVAPPGRCRQKRVHGAVERRERRLKQVVLNGPGIARRTAEHAVVGLRIAQAELYAGRGYGHNGGTHDHRPPRVGLTAVLVRIQYDYVARTEIGALGIGVGCKAQPYAPYARATFCLGHKAVD